MRQKTPEMEFKIKRLQELAEEVNRTLGSSWEDLVFHVDLHKGSICEACGIAIILRAQLDQSLKDNETLRQRMEDVCKEMELIRGKPSEDTRPKKGKAKVTYKKADFPKTRRDP